MSFLPHTFRNGGHEVTVNSDRSIKVRQGDWLSKYSMAIYGDFDHMDQFSRMVNGDWTRIDNRDLIETGETLYHPNRLPDEPESAYEDSGPPFQTRHVWRLLNMIKLRFEPSQWRAEMENTPGVPFISVRHRIRFTKSNGSASVLFRIEDEHVMCKYQICEGKPYPERMHDFGIILRLRGSPLTDRDRYSEFFLMEFGRNLCHSGGRPVSLVLFGDRCRSGSFMRSLSTYLRYGSPTWLPELLEDTSGVMIAAPTPMRELPNDNGFIASAGYMVAV
jgi:hypothetical protein